MTQTGMQIYARTPGQAGVRSTARGLFSAWEEAVEQHARRAVLQLTLSHMTQQWTQMKL